LKKDHHHTHILLLCSGLNAVGGQEKMVVSFANSLAQEGYRISILIVGDTTESFYPIDGNINVALLNADFGIGSRVNYLKRKINFIKDIVRLKKAISKISPNLIITTEYSITTAAILGGLAASTKAICWQHSSFTIKKSFLWDKASKYAYKKIHCIVALNAAEQKSYSFYNSHTVVIPNFIPSAKSISDLSSKTILTIARFDAVKGIDLLIPAAAIVLNQHPDWQWKLIGKGDLQKEYSSSISKYGWHKNLIVQAPVSNEISNEYQQAAIYVLPSRNELFPMVLLEAMSHGVPCIAFDCDTGPRHIITHNIDGILVEKENPEKLAEAISLLIRDKEKRNHMGKAAFENVKRFTSDIVLKKWEALFNSLLHS